MPGSCNVSFLFVFLCISHFGAGNYSYSLEYSEHMHPHLVKPLAAIFVSLASTALIHRQREELSAGRSISRTREPAFRRVQEWALPVVMWFQKRFPEHLLAGKHLQTWLVRAVSSPGMTCLLSPPWSAGQLRRPLHNWLVRAESYNRCYVAIISSASLGFHLQDSAHRTF